ncbi:MAG: OmpA family protein [Deltaproteobacteria bacterium]|nr:OmpA family protein [Deltaproteobacteria bacterium]
MRKGLSSILLILTCVLLLGYAHPLAAEETEIPGVTAELGFARQYNGVLHLGIRLRNTGDKEAATGKPIPFGKIVLADAKAAKKYSPLKGADGRYLAGPVSDWSDGGRWFPLIPAKSEILLWVLFDAVPQGASLSIQVPLMFPFEGVAASEQPATAKEVGSALPPLRASFVSAARSAGQLKVRLKVTHPGKQKVQGLPLRYADAYAFDPASKRKYPVLKDQAGIYLAQPISDNGDGGRFWYAYVEPGGQALVSLTFQPPPDTVRAVDIMIPLLEPFENIPVAGEGGAGAAGIATAGKSQDLEGALKELNAEVTAQEIKVQLRSDLLFDFDKAEIKKEAAPVLEKVALVLRSNPGAKVLVEGHTDGVGKDSYNKALSEKRAAVTARWLIAASGIPASQVQTRGWGKTRPVAHNTKPDGADDPEGRAKNRRVEIIIRKAAP